MSACLFEETCIEHYQAANNLSKPLDGLYSRDLNRELVKICERIELAANPYNQLHAMNCAGVSPPDDSLIYGRAFARRQEWIGTMSSDLRAAARDTEHAASALVPRTSALLIKGAWISACARLAY